MTAYPNLLQPGKLGRHEVKNRVWMTAHATLLVKEHLFSDQHIAYYVERARGGVGTITMEAMAVHPTTQPYKGKAFAFDPRMIAQYRKIADAVHNFGAKILAQPWHRGRQTNSVTSEEPVWAPSAVPCSVYREMPHVMTEADIDEIVEGYRLSARYAREGGLDGIEVHGMAHGYLLGQFLSPATNFRQDAYGGSLENRLRIVRRIIAATREEAGPDLIVGARINSADGGRSGLQAADWAEIAAQLEADGGLDFLSCSHGTYLNRMLIYPTSPEEHGYQMEATGIVKAATSLPVVGVGRIVNPEEAEKFIAEGKCDYVGLSRALIADPDWVVKAMKGNQEAIRPCVGANWCLESIFAHAPIACIHNPAAGKEMELGGGTLKPAALHRKVAVVGAGPAGMQAAVTAAARGHAVTLFEREAQVGGQVAWFASTEVRSELGGIIRHLSGRLAAAGVTVRTGVTIEAADLTDFDAVIVATGSEPLRHGWSPLRPEHWDGPDLPGIQASNILTLADILGPRRKPLGERVVLYDTLGGRQAVVAADHIASTGHRLHFITTLGQVAPNLQASRDWGKVYGRLRRKGVQFDCDRELVAVGNGVAKIRDLYVDTIEEVPFDSMVLIIGSSANDRLFRQLKQKAELEVFAIGDCLAPRRVSDAIREGELIAREI